MVDFPAATVEADDQLTGRLELLSNLPAATAEDDVQLTGAMALITLMGTTGSAEDSVEISGALHLGLPLSGTVEDDVELSASTMPAPLAFGAASIEAAEEASASTFTTTAIDSPTDFAGAYELVGASGSVLLETAGASLEVGEPPQQYGYTNTIWVKLVLTEPRYVHFLPSAEDAPFAQRSIPWDVFSGTSLAGLALVASSVTYDTSMFDGHLPAGTHYFRFTSSTDGSGYVQTNVRFLLTWSVGATPAAANKDSASAVAISLDSGTTAVSTDTLTRSAWYAWTCPADGLYEFDTMAGLDEVDTTIEVYDSTGAVLAYADDQRVVNGRSLVGFRGSAGQIYHVVITCWSGGWPKQRVADDAILTWRSQGNPYVPFGPGGVLLDDYGPADYFQGNGKAGCAIASTTFALLVGEQTFQQGSGQSVLTPDVDTPNPNCKIWAVNPTTGAVLFAHEVTAAPGTFNTPPRWQVWRIDATTIGFYGNRSTSSTVTGRGQFIGTASADGTVRISSDLDFRGLIRDLVYLPATDEVLISQIIQSSQNLTHLEYTGLHDRYHYLRVHLGSFEAREKAEVLVRAEWDLVLAEELGSWIYDSPEGYRDQAGALITRGPHTVYAEHSGVWKAGTQNTSGVPDVWDMGPSDSGSARYAVAGDPLVNMWGFQSLVSYLQAEVDGAPFYEHMVQPLPAGSPAFEFAEGNTGVNYTAPWVYIYGDLMIVLNEHGTYDFSRLAGSANQSADAYGSHYSWQAYTFASIAEVFDALAFSAAKGPGRDRALQAAFSGRKGPDRDLRDLAIPASGKPLRVY